MSLHDFLLKADVPNSRRDLTKPENIRWLVNNLGIRNSDLPDFDEAFQELKRLMK
jgi:hypothetical protein